MRNDLYEHLVYVIDEQCPWIRVIDSNYFRPHQVFYNHRCITIVGRTLILQNVVDHDNFCKGYQWVISEYELDRALAILKRQRPSVSVRLFRGVYNIMPCEISTIIELATHGMLKLDLRTLINTYPYL